METKMNIKKLLVIILLVAVAGTVLGQDAQNVRQIGQISHWEAEDIAMQGDYAYVAAGNSGLRILDVTDPARPVEVGFISTPGFAQGITIAEEYAYIADSWADFLIVDISDPTEPVEIGFYDDFPGQAEGVAITEDYVFVTYGDGGLVVLDISDPENPEMVATLETDNEYFDIVASGEHAYIAGNESGMHILDISDPIDPSEIGSLFGEAYEIVVNEDEELAYIAGGAGGFRISNISDPRRPTQRAILETGGSVEAVTVAGEFAYVSDNQNGVLVIDISDPRNPAVVGGQDTNSLITGLFLHEEQYLVCGSSGMGGLHVLDISDARNPDEVGFYSLERRAIGVEVSGGYACMIGDMLTVVDVSNPHRPATLGSIDLPGSSDPLSIGGNHVYVPCGSAGLRVYDISDPTNPTEVGAINPGRPLRDVVVVENLAYAVSQWDLWIIDISDPSQMEPVGYFDAHGRIFYRSIDISNGYAFIPAHEGGLRILDVSDPRHITEVAYVGNLGSPSAAVADENFVYVSSWEDGMWVVDISDPSQPIEVGFCDIPLSRDISKESNQVYLACNWAGMRVIDVSDPEDPVEVGFYDGAHDNTSGVAAVGDIVYAAEHNAFGIYEYTHEREVSVNDGSPSLLLQFNLTSYPNPFNAIAGINYTLPMPGNMAISVYDLTGKEVARLAHGWQSAGQYRTAWNATGIPSGTYLIRLDGGEFNAVKTIQLVR